MNENADEIVKALRWLAKETEFKFAADALNASAALIESLQAQLAKTREHDIENTRSVARLCNELSAIKSQLTESQRRERAAVDLIAEVEKMINSGAEWFDAGAGEWGDAMERYRGEPGEEHRFKMSMHIRDAYRVGVERFDLAGAKIDRWRGPDAGEGEAE